MSERKLPRQVWERVLSERGQSGKPKSNWMNDIWKGMREKELEEMNGKRKKKGV